jgi:microcystin-dependent protein
VDAEYNRYGKAGGGKTVTLTEAQMPSHTHSLKDYYFIEASGSMGGVISGKESAGGRYEGAGDSDGDNDTLAYKTHDTNPTGSGASHENRQPYYVLAYVMKTKN